ncbi:hypothetical protein MPH_04454, partial [Macrophomina phaseolina MS6]
VLKYEQPFTAGDTQEEKHEQPFTTTDPMEQRRKIVTFLQNRTHERLAVQEERLKAKEAQLAAEGLQLIQQWRVLNQESTELLHQKMAFCQVRMILHNNCENPQNLPVSRFQHLGEQLNKEIDRLEKVRPNSTAHVLANLVGTPDRKDFGVKLQTKAEPSNEQPKTKTEHMVNAGKELATFFQARDDTKVEQKAAVAAFETVPRPSIEEAQKQHDAPCGHSTERPATNGDPTEHPSEPLKIPCGFNDALTLIGGISNQLDEEKQEVIRAVDAIS